MSPPTNIDGTDITGASIDGQDVEEITIDGQTVFVARRIVDDFEDGDLNEYVGATGNFSFSSTTVFNGSQALQASGGGGTIASDSGLANFPAMGDTFKCHVNFSGTDDLEVGYGGNGAVSGLADEGYGVDVDAGGDFVFRRFDGGGSFTELARTNPSIPTNRYLRVLIEWVNNNHTIELFDTTNSNKLSTITVSDATYSNNTGIFLRDGGSGSAGGFFDLYEII